LGRDRDSISRCFLSPKFTTHSLNPQLRKGEKEEERKRGGDCGATVIFNSNLLQ
jgi:hypothetical protein